MLSWKRIHLQCRRPGFDPWFGKIPWRRDWLPTPVFWPREFHRLYSPQGCKESETTEGLSLHSLAYSGPSSLPTIPRPNHLVTELELYLPFILFLKYLKITCFSREASSKTSAVVPIQEWYDISPAFYHVAFGNVWRHFVGTYHCALLRVLSPWSGQWLRLLICRQCGN